MRDLIRQIVQRYASAKLQGQDEGTVVFTAQDPDTKQQVTIKIPARLLGDDPQIATRFRGLAQTIRQLNHPNIASVRDVGEKAGLPYVVTRAIERAQPLATKLNQPWAVDAAADAVVQAGQALDHAYRKGLVHGSLSPQNVLVEENGHVRVTDFGLSQIRDLIGAQVKQAASPYRAPERIVGKPADARADVYSLGALLYALLAQRSPQVAQGQVLPPSRFNPEVPAAMDQVVVKALATDPANRYPDVKSFLAALSAVTLAPLVEKAQTVTPEGSCPKCGAKKQTGRFCRKCGTRLKQPEPVGEEAKGEVQAAEAPEALQAPAPALSVAAVVPQVSQVANTGFSAAFPEPLPMPQVDLQGVWQALGAQVQMAMPEPPPMPVIDWASMVPRSEMPTPSVPSQGVGQKAQKPKGE